MGGGTTALRGVWIVAIVVRIELGGAVGVLNARARRVARKPTERIVGSPAAITTGFELLTSQTAGKNISGVVKTAPECVS